MEAGDVIDFGPGKTWLVLWGIDHPEVAWYPSPITGCSPFLSVEVTAP